LPAFAAAEMAKRRLIVELSDLKLPIVGRDQDPERGLAFDLLSSAQETVLTGHDDGLITLNLAEGDDVHREQLRIAMDEPYRTLLGHFRHEIGHYYFDALDRSSHIPRSQFQELFGDPNTDYQQALDRHYDQGAPTEWEMNYVSSYATMHPAEDWAETFAHYLHIRDTLDTSAAFEFAPSGATFDRRALGPSAFNTIIEMWLPLAWSLNMVNRSMGRDDLYPFVLPDDAVRAALLDSTGGYFVGPYSEARQCVGAERVAECDVGGVAATRDQYPADARGVVARVEGMPLPAEEHLEPGREIHRIVHWRHTDVAEVPGAVARGDVHAATEGNRKVGEITADSGPVIEGFQRRPCLARVLIPERDVSVNEVADCLNPAPSRWRLPEEIPCCLRQPIGFAIPAPEQEDKGVLG
jgi:Putative zinc-binding metallo-peptidase